MTPAERTKLIEGARRMAYQEMSPNTSCKIVGALCDELERVAGQGSFVDPGSIEWRLDPPGYPACTGVEWAFYEDYSVGELYQFMGSCFCGDTGESTIQ